MDSIGHGGSSVVEVVVEIILKVVVLKQTNGTTERDILLTVISELAHSLNVAIVVVVEEEQTWNKRGALYHPEIFLHHPFS